MHKNIVFFFFLHLQNLQVDFSYLHLLGSQMQPMDNQVVSQPHKLMHMVNHVVPHQHKVYNHQISNTWILPHLLQPLKTFAFNLLWTHVIVLNNPRSPITMLDNIESPAQLSLNSCSNQQLNDTNTNSDNHTPSSPAHNTNSETRSPLALGYRVTAIFKFILEHTYRCHPWNFWCLMLTRPNQDWTWTDSETWSPLVLRLWQANEIWCCYSPVVLEMIMSNFSCWKS